MLFKTVSEIKKCLPANAAFEFGDIEPFIQLQAEPNFLIPVLSQEQYDLLNAKYNDSAADLTDDEKQLLGLCRFATANYAYLLYTPFGQVNISKSGIHIETSETKKTAFQWQLDELKSGLINAAFIGLENLLKFLEIKKGIFTAWASSETFTLLHDSFINSADDFDEYYRISKSRLTFLAVKPIIRIIEQNLLYNNLGKDLYDLLKSEIQADNIAAENKLLLNQYIKPALANLTMARALSQLSVRITENGVVVFMGSLSQNTRYFLPAGEDAISRLYQQAITDGNNALEGTKRFLNANASPSAYPSYYNSSLYIAPGTSPEKLNDPNWGIGMV